MGHKIAVIGDGKFGLLIAQNLVVAGHQGHVTHFGRHQEKLDLVEGTTTEIVGDDTKVNFAQVCGSPQSKKILDCFKYFWGMSRTSGGTRRSLTCWRATTK